MMDDGSSVLLKSDITPSPCSMDKLDIASAKSPDSISSQCSKMSSTTNQSSTNTNNNSNNNSSNVFRTDKLATEERPVEINTEDMEPALRRSKRGKGRPSNVHNNNNSNNNNNDGSSDDHVPSCIVSGVEYRTGDFVYYEEPDFEYFTIGLIEEIKVSRRDKFSVFIKCFYRTRDIPEISKQALPDRDNYPANSNVKFIRDIFARELFVSEVQETLPAKQLRGVCKVNYLPDLKTALTTFSPDEDDSFFYVFAYNPETRRLSKIRAEIRVGQAYQAALPEFRHHPPAAYRFNNRNHCVNHSRKRKRCTHKSAADQDTHSLPPHYDHHHHGHHPRKHRRTNNASPHQLTTVNTLHNHELQPSNNAVSDAPDEGGIGGGDGGDICGTVSKMSDDDTADADDNKPLINKPKMDIPKSPKKLDTDTDNDDHVDDHSDNDMPCKTEVTTLNAPVDMSESIKNISKMESSSMSEPLASNLPPKLENANHFDDDDRMSVDPMNTDDLDHPPPPSHQSHNHRHYHNHHHRRHQCHPACNHKNHVYPGRQSHHRKRKRGGGHRRCCRRKSQKREILVWSPCGLSSALSASCKDFNSIIATVTTVNDHQNNPHTGENDDNNNNSNNNANTVLNNISSDFNSMLSDEPLKNYLDAVRSMVAFFGFGGAEDDLSSAENGLVLANLAATTQHAYDTLHKCKYSLRNALQAISCNPIVAKDTPRHWTAEQVRLFAHALRIHGKDFFTIQRNFFGGKTSSNNNNNNNNNNNSNTNNINNNNSATIANGVLNANQTGGTGRMRGRGRRKLVPGTASASKLSSMKSDETEGNSTTATVTSTSAGGKLEEVKPEDPESLHDNGESAENNAATTQKGFNDGNGNTSSGLLSTTTTTTTTTSEPVKTVKELIAFYYYWKRKGTSSSSLGGGHGGLSTAAANFATAVVAAALNTDNTLPSLSVNSSSTGSGVPSSSSSSSAAVTASEAGNHSNGNIFSSSSSQTHFNASAVKKRKATNRGCVLTKQAWLGIIEYRKAAEYELRRLLTLKAEKGVGADGGGQQQATVNYQSLTQQTGDDKSESVGPSQPESEVEENFETTNAGTDDAVDVPVNSGEKNEEGTTISTTATTVDGNADSASTGSRLRKRLCRNCSAELSSSEDSPPPPLLGQLRFLCPGCRIHLQKYGELKCTVEEQEENIIDDALSEVTHPITNDEQSGKPDMSSVVIKQMKSNSVPNTPKPCNRFSDKKRHKKRILRRLMNCEESPQKKEKYRSCYESSTTTNLSSPISSPYSLQSNQDEYYSASESSLSSSSSFNASQCCEDSDCYIGSDDDDNDNESTDTTMTSSSCNSPLTPPPPRPPRSPAPDELDEVTTKLESSDYYPSSRHHKKKNRLCCPSESKHHDKYILSKVSPPPKLDENAEMPIPTGDNIVGDVKENRYAATGLQNKTGPPHAHHLDNKSILPTTSCSSSSTTPSDIHSISNCIDSHDTKGHISHVLYSMHNERKENYSRKSSTALPLQHIDDNHHYHQQLTDESDVKDMHQGDVDDDDAGSVEDELEMENLINATNESNPASCYVDAYRSTWSHLVRIWNRQVNYPQGTDTTNSNADSSLQLQKNIGSCARTDLIYCGRGIDIPVNNHEFWNMQRHNLYAKYVDTAIGPGVNTYLSSVSSTSASSSHLPSSSLATASVASAVGAGFADGVMDHKTVFGNEIIKSEAVMNLLASNAYYAENTSFAHTPSSSSLSSSVQDTSSTALDLCARNSKRSSIQSSSSSYDQPAIKTCRSSYHQNDPGNMIYPHSNNNNNNSILTPTGQTGSMPSMTMTPISQIPSFPLLPPQLQQQILMQQQQQQSGSGIKSPIGSSNNNNNIPSQQQLQTMYEQALLFAAAAAGHYQHNSPSRDGMKFFPPNFEMNTTAATTTGSNNSNTNNNPTKQMPVVSSPNLRFINPNNNNNCNNNSNSGSSMSSLMSTRIAAATGTFYPPISSISSSSSSSSATGTSTTASDSAPSLFPMHHNNNSSNNNSNHNNNNTSTHGMNRSMVNTPFNFSLTDSQCQPSGGGSGAGGNLSAHMSMSAGGSSSSTPSMLGLNPSITSGGGYNGLGCSSSNPFIPPGSPFYSHPELLQRQLALMGLLPPTSLPSDRMASLSSAAAAAASVEQREIDAFQRLMSERLEYLRNATNSQQQQQQQQQRTMTPVEQFQLYQQQQLQQQQEILAAAFSAEMAARLEGGIGGGGGIPPSSIYPHQNSSLQLQPPLPPPSRPLPPATPTSMLIGSCLSHSDGNNGGAMTSAVNSISTRPTASVQLSHNPRYPQSSSASIQFSSGPTNRFPQNQHQHHQDIHNLSRKTPPIAHHNSSSSSRDMSMNLNNLSSINPATPLLSPFNVGHTRASPHMPFTSPITHGGSSSGGSNSGRAASRNPTIQPPQPSASSSSSSNLQEQVFNAAKLAMMAANIQSDPNKALQFASLAAAAFAEMASQDKKSSLPRSSLPAQQQQQPQQHPSAIQDSLSQRNMNAPASHVRLRSPAGQFAGSNSDCNINNNSTTSGMPNFMNQGTHKERRRQNSHMSASIPQSSGPSQSSSSASSNRLLSPLHHSHSESRSLSNRTPTPATNNRMHQSSSSSSQLSNNQSSNNNDSPMFSGPTIPGMPPGQLAQLAQLAQMSGLPPGFSFQDPAVLNAFALAAAATSLVAGGGNQSDNLLENNPINTTDRYRSPLSQQQQRYPTTNTQQQQYSHHQQQQQHQHQQQQQQQQAAVAAAAAAMANAFGLPAQFNSRLSSSQP